MKVTAAHAFVSPTPHGFAQFTGQWNMGGFSAEPIPQPGDVPLDPKAENYKWAPSPADRRKSIPTAHGLTGILPLQAPPEMTTLHFNGSEARPRISPTAIVVHSTAGGVGRDAMGWKQFVEGNDGVGTQYYVLKSGEIVEVESPDRQAWHAVAQATNGTWNNSSVGIEIVNGNQNPAGTEPYTVAQLEATRLLTRYLATRFEIPRDSIVLHRQIQPQDRTDPVGLPWHHFLLSVGNDRPWSGPIYQSGPNDPGTPA